MTDAAYICPRCLRVAMLAQDQQPKLGKPIECPAHNTAYPFQLAFWHRIR